MIDLLYKNLVYKLPNEYLYNFKNRNDYDYICKEYRMDLYLVVMDIEIGVFQFDISKIFHQKYKLFTENKISEKKLHKYLKYTSYFSDLKNKRLINQSKIKFASLLHKLKNNIPEAYEILGPRQLYGLHQADITDNCIDHFEIFKCIYKNI